MRLRRFKPDELLGPAGQISVGERMYLQTSIFDAVSKVFDSKMDSITDMNQWLINATQTVKAAIAAGSSPALYKEDFIDINADDGDGDGDGEGGLMSITPQRRRVPGHLDCGMGKCTAAFGDCQASGAS